MCRWEDDGQDDDDAELVRGGPNQDYSLADARLNFDDYLVMYPPEADTRLGGPDSEQTKAIKRRIIDAFEPMMTEPPTAELDKLWAIVQEGEQALEDEVRRQVACRVRPDH